MKEVTNGEILKIVKGALRHYKNHTGCHGICHMIDLAIFSSINWTVSNEEIIRTRLRLVSLKEWEDIFSKHMSPEEFDSFMLKKACGLLGHYFWWRPILSNKKRNSKPRVNALKDLIAYYKTLPENEVAMVI